MNYLQKITSYHLSVVGFTFNVIVVNYLKLTYKLTCNNFNLNSIHVYNIIGGLSIVKFLFTYNIEYVCTILSCFGNDLYLKYTHITYLFSNTRYSLNMLFILHMPSNEQ